MKKKIAAVLMAMALTVSVCACSKKDEKEETEKTKKTTAEETSEEDPTDETTEESAEETSDSTEESTDETTEESTEDTTKASKGTAAKKDFGDATGIDAVKMDLENSGFKINDTTDVTIGNFEGATAGFSAVNDKEEFYYLEYATEDEVKAIDEKGLPLPAAGRTRIGMGDVTWHYDMDDTNKQFQCLIINPNTKQILFYKGTEERGARCNTYAMELGIIPEMNGWASFEEDPEYPDGKPLTTKPQEAPDVSIKNEKAKELMDTLTAEGCKIVELPAEGFSTDDIGGDYVGYMATGAETGKYAGLTLFMYAESDPADLVEAFEQMKTEASNSANVAKMEIKEDGNIKTITADMMGTVVVIVFDLDNGYMAEIMTSDAAMADEIVAACGMSV